MSPKLSKPLSPGDVITEDTPIVHTLELKSKGKYCDNCIKRSDQLKSCPFCLYMFYCGKKCLNNDWKYHKYECPVYRPNWPMITKPVLKSVRLWLRLYLSVQNIPTFATEKHRLFDGSEVSLNDIKDKTTIKDNEYKSLFETICDLLKALALPYDRQHFHQWFAFMMNIGWYDIVCGDAEGVSAVATALFPVMSTLSHSCQPNSAYIYKYDGRVIELRAMRSIAPGEEITICFGDPLLNQSERRAELKSQGIDCQCVKCVDNTDRDVDYKRLKSYVNTSVISGLVADGQLETYLRSLLADLDVVYGDYEPYKTFALYYCFNDLRQHLVDSRSAPDRLFNEVRDMTAKALDVTTGDGSPFKRRFYRNLNLFYSSL